MQRVQDQLQGLREKNKLLNGTIENEMDIKVGPDTSTTDPENPEPSQVQESQITPDSSMSTIETNPELSQAMVHRVDIKVAPDSLMSTSETNPKPSQVQESQNTGSPDSNPLQIKQEAFEINSTFSWSSAENCLVKTYTDL